MIFDKTAKILDLGYPGGPKVEKFAKLGNKNSYDLPKPIINRGGCNLSLAGLKTAVLRKSKEINLDKERYNLAASFQYTINKILVEKTKVAMKIFREKISDRQPSKTFVVAGGVAANEIIRKDLIDLSKKMNFKPIFPSKEFCGDNAAMIAWAGIKRFKKKLLSNDMPVKSRWPLDKKAPFLKGPGLKL